MSRRDLYRRPVGCGDDLEEDCAPAIMATLPSLRDSNSEDIYSNNLRSKAAELNTQQRCDSGYGDSAEYSISFSGSFNSGTALHRITEEEKNSLHKDFQDLHLTQEEDTKCILADEGVHDILPSITEDEENVKQPSEMLAAVPEAPLHWEQFFTQDEDGDTLLHMAIIQMEVGHAQHIMSLATCSQLLDVQNSQQQTPLHLAVLTNQPGVVRLLVSCGASLEVRDRSGNTPLHIACREGRLDCIGALTMAVGPNEIRHPRYTPQPHRIPQDLDIKNYEGLTCLHLAAAKGHLPVLSFLLQHCDADVNVQEGKSGRTILHQAVESNNQQVVNFLVQQSGLQLEALTYDSRTALCLAHDRQLSHLQELLLDVGADRASIYGNSSFLDPDDDMMDNRYDDFCIAGQPLYS